MKEGIESWENELWSYINSGDGVRCPHSDSCELEKERVGCFNNEEERKKTRKIHTFVDDDDIDFKDYKKINLRFSECTKQGKVFDLVIKLAQKFRSKNWHGSIPVPDNLILKDYNNLPIEISYIRLKVNHGAVWRLNDSWLIHLNSNDPLARQRFTVYHEIFHILAHCQGNPVFKRANGGEVSYNEILADHFAANILLPRELVVKKWSETKNIDKMAEIFIVPKPVMWGSLRMNRLI
jgi:hypothetical protein